MRPTTFQPPLTTLRMQWAAMLLVALVVSNALMRGPLPFSTGYRFPVSDFLTLFLAILSICEANKAVYRYLDKKLPFDQHTTKRLIWQGIGSFLATLFFYVPLHFLNARLTNETVSAHTFLFYAFVAFSISAGFNGVHIIAYFVRLVKYQKLPHNSPAPPQDQTLTIDTGNRTLILDPQQISWWHSSGGTVSLVKTDGAQFTTNYSSFAMIADRLSERHFFHLTRQVIAHRKSIDSIQHGQNGQLIVSLRTPDPGRQSLKVIVSRYKKAAFQTWLDSSTN